jgi:hypothetical protein
MRDEVASTLVSIVDITAVGEMFAARQFDMRGKVTQHSASTREWEQNTIAVH